MTDLFMVWNRYRGVIPLLKGESGKFAKTWQIASS
jgi:hypothetical protein